MAEGADVLVHETITCRRSRIHQRPDRPRAASEFEAFMAHMKADHTVRRCRSHRSAGGRQNACALDLAPAIDSISDDTWREPAAKFFKGEIIVGKDLMVV